MVLQYHARYITLLIDTVHLYILLFSTPEFPNFGLITELASNTTALQFLYIQKVPYLIEWIFFYWKLFLFILFITFYGSLKIVPPEITIFVQRYRTGTVQEL